MPDFPAILDGTRKGDYTVDYLRTEYGKELEQLATANTSYQTGGWMACKDLLSGDTAEAKMADFVLRTKAAGDAHAYIQECDASVKAFAALGQLAPVDASPRKAVGPAEHPVPDYAGLPDGYKAYLQSREAVAFSEMSPAQREDYIRPGQTLGRQKAREYAVYLKASLFASSPTGTGGLLPTDRVGMPYPMLIDPLMFFRITSEPGSIIRYWESYEPQIANLATGEVRARARGGALNDLTQEATLRQVPKQSLGVITDIPKEDLRDNGMISERMNSTLDIAMKTALITNIFRGNGGLTGANNQWRGIMPALTSAPSTNELNNVDVNHNTVAVSSGFEEPIAFFETLLAALAYRGVMPTCVFVNAADWGKIRASQRVLRNQADDYLSAPWGRIAAVPLCLCRDLGTNQSLIIDTATTFDIVLGEEVQTGISEDYRFGSNMVSLRRVMDGNVVIEKPFAAIKVTATNLLAAATLS